MGSGQPKYRFYIKILFKISEQPRSIITNLPPSVFTLRDFKIFGFVQQHTLPVPVRYTVLRGRHQFNQQLDTIHRFQGISSIKESGICAERDRRDIQPYDLLLRCPRVGSAAEQLQGSG